MSQQRIIQNDGLVIYYPNWVNDTFKTIDAAIEWQQETITLFGNTVKVPRLVAWYGDKGVSYRYSGTDHIANGWPDRLYRLKQKLTEQFDTQFNSVLANLYRNGRDYMGWHSDQERELGSQPLIASLSFGASRTFKFRHQHTKEIIELLLHHGDLLIMQGDCQHYWQHCLPKRLRVTEPRINLTFRTIKDI